MKSITVTNDSMLDGVKTTLSAHLPSKHTSISIPQKKDIIPENILHPKLHALRAVEMHYTFDSYEKSPVWGTSHVSGSGDKIWRHLFTRSKDS